MEKCIALVTLSYVLGSVPFSLIIAKIIGVNLRKVGSKNVGATNIARTGDKKLAFLALFLDSLKGFIAVYISQKLCKCNPEYSLCIPLSAILVVLGHMFSMWLKFSGGKGVATTLGVLMAINVYLTLLFIFVWLVVFLSFGYSSLASLTATAVATLATLFFQKELFFMLLGIAILICLRHHRNISNLLQKKEYRFL